MTNHEITETSTAHTHTFKHKFTLTATTEATEQKARSALQLHQPKSHRKQKICITETTTKTTHYLTKVGNTKPQ